MVGDKEATEAMALRKSVLASHGNRPRGELPGNKAANCFRAHVWHGMLGLSRKGAFWSLELAG